MAIRVAINGFGRIGRLALRALLKGNHEALEVVAINDLAPLTSAAHLLQYDSVHGTCPEPVSCDGEKLVVGSRSLSHFSYRHPCDLPWESMEIDLVLECTGHFTSHEKASEHLEAGARRVLISAPANDADLTVVYGVNHQRLEADHVIVSNASCTTNCLAPVAKVIHDAYSIEHGFMTTIHAYTGDQTPVDSVHPDPYRARAAALSLIPTSTGAARAVGSVLPELAGKLDGIAIRAPVPNVSAVDLTCVVANPTTVDAVNATFREACNDGPLTEILSVSDAPLVSTDFNHTEFSAIIASGQTRVTADTLVRILAWYDNEWAFSHRMLDTACAMASFLEN